MLHQVLRALWIRIYFQGLMQMLLRGSLQLQDKFLCLHISLNLFLLGLIWDFSFLRIWSMAWTVCLFLSCLYQYQYLSRSQILPYSLQKSRQALTISWLLSLAQKTWLRLTADWAKLIRSVADQSKTSYFLVRFGSLEPFWFVSSMLGFASDLRFQTYCFLCLPE